MARKIKAGYEWPFYKRNFRGHEIAATNQISVGLWHVYIDGRYIHNKTFKSKKEAFQWLEYTIRKNEE